jgi:hypothetical protein
MFEQSHTVAYANEHHKNDAEVAFYARWNLVLQMQKSNSKYIIIIRVIMCFLSTPKQTTKPPGTKCPRHSCSIGSIFLRSAIHEAYRKGGL